jgi:hypothetical protein
MLAFWSSQFAQELTNFLGGPVQTAEGLAGLGFVTIAWKCLECHHNHPDNCHKFGRFRHGHLKLCHIHHPLVPNDGLIGKEHIDSITI